MIRFRNIGVLQNKISRVVIMGKHQSDAQTYR